MKRRNSATVWQLRLFDGLDADVMVLQRDEQEVFEDAIHVFFDKEYYDSYVSKARKHSNHSYAYHEDKLGEVIYQVFDEKIEGLVLHMNFTSPESKGVLCREKYLSLDELRVIEDPVRAYHYLYTVSIERMSKEEALANLWMEDVFIIGQMMPTVEFMTLKRKNDGTPVTDDQYDYEAIKIFLTYESAMKYNPDNKPVNRYKLGMIAQFIRGNVKVIIEPHRNYWLEFDPETINLSEYLHAPNWNDETVQNRIQELVNKDKLYILLSVANSDYGKCVGTPFIIRENGETMIYVYENYDDAVRFACKHPVPLPAFDGVYPIGVLSKDDKMANLNTILAVCNGLGVYSLFTDNETKKGLCFKIPFFMEKAGLSTELESFMAEEDWKKIKHVSEEGETKYSIPLVPFVNNVDEYAISDERKESIAGILDKEDIVIRSFMADANISEVIFALGEVSRRFDEARKAGDTITMSKVGSLMNLLTNPLAEKIYEMPYIFTLKKEDGSFVTHNDLPYLVVTNRYESGRKGEGVPMPIRTDNEEFMNELEAMSKVAILTDGPNALCIVDVHKLAEHCKEYRKEETLHEEMMIYMTEGCGLAYDDACARYRRLKADSALFNEFVSNVRNGAYSSYGSIDVEGWTAEDLAEKKGMNMLEAYETLLDMEIKSVLGQKNVGPDSTSDDDVSEDKSEKKGLFGKLFKK